MDQFFLTKKKKRWTKINNDGFVFFFGASPKEDTTLTATHFLLLSHAKHSDPSLGTLSSWGGISPQAYLIPRWTLNYCPRIFRRMADTLTRLCPSQFMKYMIIYIYTYIFHRRPPSQNMCGSEEAIYMRRSHHSTCINVLLNTSPYFQV